MSSVFQKMHVVLFLMFCRFTLASDPDLELVTAIPSEFDGERKIECLNFDNVNACISLVRDFVAATNFSGNSSDLFQRVDRMRLQLQTSFYDLSRKFEKCNLNVSNPRPGTVHVARTWKFFAAVHERKKLADELHFWRHAISEKSSAAFFTFFQAIKTLDDFHRLCKDPVFVPILTPNLTNACNPDSSWFLIDKLITNFRLASSGSLRRMFWSHVSVIDPRFSTVREAALAVPLEFSPPLKLQCSRGTYSYCLTLLTSFNLVVSTGELALSAADFRYPEAQLHGFTILMKSLTVNLTRSLMREDGQLSGRLDRLLSDSRVTRANRFFPFLTRTGSEISAESSLSRGFENFFNYISSTSLSWFWQIHFRVKTVEELEGNMRAVILEKRVFDPLFSGLRTLCRDRRLREAMITSKVPSLIAISEACFKLPTTSSLIIDLFRDECKQELLHRLDSWWNVPPIHDWFFHLVQRELRYEYFSELKEGEVLGDCPICMEPLLSVMQTMLTPCRHRYHSVCLCKWLSLGNTKCPMCRGALPLPRF